MTQNPLRSAIASAGRATDRLGDLFGSLGTNEHPRGSILVAYRNANRALKGAMREEHPQNAVTDIMTQLRRTVQVEVNDALHQGAMLGVEEAARQLSYYEIDAGFQDAQLYELAQTQEAAVKAVLSEIDQQNLRLQALLLTDQTDMILGDEERQGVLRAAAVLLTALDLIALLTWDAYTWFAKRNQRGSNFSKQAVSAIDHRTTDCCLRVHGQIQPLTGKYKLTGTPRFADELSAPPFHNYCRTATVLYLNAYDDGITEELINAAKKVLAERAAGTNKRRHPADAYA